MSKSPKIVAAAGLMAIAALSTGQADANTISATLGIQYFQVAIGSNPPDFGGSGTANVANGSALGPDGLPVAGSPAGIADVLPGTNEVTWWSPAFNSSVVATGTGVVSLPYSSNMYAPNSTGSNDGSFFETAILTGNFILSSPESVEFQLGSDDDSYIYVDGILIGQNPGIHGVTNVDFSSAVLGIGSHTLQVFYADRESSGAYLSLNLLSEDVVITPPTDTPEPASLALFGASLAGLGFIRRRIAR